MFHSWLFIKTALFMRTTTWGCIMITGAWLDKMLDSSSTCRSLCKFLINSNFLIDLMKCRKRSPNLKYQKTTWSLMWIHQLISKDKFRRTSCATFAWALSMMRLSASSAAISSAESTYRVGKGSAIIRHARAAKRYCRESWRELIK